jgi:VIT1/CCC1 family predicted Fe2+/Mn2+ transporter
MAALLLGTLVAIIRAPKAIVHTGDLIVHRATRIAVPAVTHHKELSKKRRVVLNRRVTFLVQVVLALLPLCASPFLPEIEDVQKEVVLIVSALLAVLSLGAFTASWLINVRPTSRTRSHGSRG